MSNAHIFLSGLAAFGGIVGLIGATTAMFGVAAESAARREDQS